MKEDGSIKSTGNPFTPTSILTSSPNHRKQQKSSDIYIYRAEILVTEKGQNENSNILGKLSEPLAREVGFSNSMIELEGKEERQGSG